MTIRYKRHHEHGYVDLPYAFGDLELAVALRMADAWVRGKARLP